MDLLSGNLSFLLYAVVAVCALAMLMLRVASQRQRRNAGFAPKAQLRKQLTAKSVLRATEIRPSLTDDNAPGHSSISLTKQ
ncbi:hypothetical protein [Streptomyces ramulosus]